MQEEPDVPVFSETALRILREEVPSDRMIDAAYRRFAAPRRRRSQRWTVARWAIAGLVFGLGVAFAADAIVHRQPPRAPPAPSAPLPSALPQHKTRSLAGSLSAQTAPSPLPPASDDTPQRVITSPPSSPAIAESQREPGGANSAAWAQAAEGLRNQDDVETRAALSVLEQTGSDSDREAARLVRAQLLLHQRDFSGARALLQDLATTARSAPVRAKARALLNQMPTHANSPLTPAASGT